jgi:hypothetical protein
MTNEQKKSTPEGALIQTTTEYTSGAEITRR